MLLFFPLKVCRVVDTHLTTLKSAFGWQLHLHMKLYVNTTESSLLLKSVPVPGCGYLVLLL